MATTITKTVKPSGGDYTSLSAWEAGMQKDLVAADEISIAECYSMSDTTSVVIDGWTGDATRYIKIYTPPAERHNGVWNTGKYILAPASGVVLQISESYVRVYGLQINTASIGILVTGGSSSGDVNGDIYIGYNIIKSNGTAANTTGIDIYYVYSSNHYIFNNIIYGFSAFSNEGIQVDDVDATAYIYNNTIYNCYRGIQATNGTIIAVNNLSYNNSVADFNGTFTTSNYNFSKDATAPGANSIHGTADAKTPDFTSTTSGSEDFHLLSTSDAIGVGTDNPGSGLYTDDIDGVTRSTSWDIGADEYIAAGGGEIYTQLERNIRGLERGLYGGF